MSDSLIIEGRQYISSRRAAEIAEYSNDYVGQLCRAGKLVCRMVGRFWYVEESSVLKHKKDSIKPNQTVFKKIDSSASSGEGVSTIVELRPAMPEINEKSEIRNLKTLDSRLHGNDKSFIDHGSSIFNPQSSIVNRGPSFVIRKSLTVNPSGAHRSDLSKITDSVSGENIGIQLDKGTTCVSADRDRSCAIVLAVPPPPSWRFTYIPTSAERFGSAIRSPYALLAPTLFAVIFIVSMIATGNSRLRPAQMFADASSGVFSLESVSIANIAETASAIQSLPQAVLGSIEDAAAGAGEALASAWSSLYSEASGLASNALPLLSSNDSRRLSNGLAVNGVNATGTVDANMVVAANSGANANAAAAGDAREPAASSVIPPSEEGRVTAEHGGVVVLPSSGSSSDQAKLEKSIQNSFSDTVTVRPNPDGTTGVIQPVFRTVAGHDFLYVLVPVKATTTSAVN